MPILPTKKVVFPYESGFDRGIPYHKLPPFFMRNFPMAFIREFLILPQSLLMMLMMIATTTMVTTTMVVTTTMITIVMTMMMITGIGVS